MGKRCTSRLAFKVTGKLKESRRVPGVALIVAQLLRQLLRRGELAGLAKPHDEVDPHLHPVEISARVEQMRFERSRRVAEGRTRPKVHHSSDRPTRRLNANHIYTFRRQKLPRRRRPEIHGGKSDR